jgi:hypothetical protein
MPIIPALQRSRQKDPKFEVSLDYIEKPCLKKTNKRKRAKVNEVWAHFL